MPSQGKTRRRQGQQLLGHHHQAARLAVVYDLTASDRAQTFEHGVPRAVVTHQARHQHQIVFFHLRIALFFDIDSCYHRP